MRTDSRESISKLFDIESIEISFRSREITQFENFLLCLLGKSVGHFPRGFENFLSWLFLFLSR